MFNKIDSAIAFRELQQDIHDNAVAHGWWDDDRSFGELIALVHSECSEALEDFRSGHGVCDKWVEARGDSAKPCGIPSELADIVIRVMDMCGRYGINLWDEIVSKHEFNKSRPYRHGGKVL